MSTLHRFKEWIRYRRKAISRHGVHSPFVYSFMEEVLQKWKKGSLKDHIAVHFREHTIVEDQWDLEGCIAGDTIIVLNNIHNSALASRQWSVLSAQPEVTLSIDLFDLGLLFFKKDFLQKQHFVLKC